MLWPAKCSPKKNIHRTRVLRLRVIPNHGAAVTIEYVSKMVGFDNLLVEVSAFRYICNVCGARECFHDVPTPYMEIVPTPTGRGWSHGLAIEDGEEQPVFCTNCKSK